jgi:uncharacterized Ntn-hydrolase superfamily protein
MTYSIVAWDPDTGMTGVAVATKHLAVGLLVPHARSGVGAVATQSATNPLLGPWGLDRLESLRGSTQPVSVAQTVLDSLVHDDPGRDLRQFHLVDSNGRTAGWTGSLSAGWAGHFCFEGYSVAGNYLAGPAPLEAMAEAYAAALAGRLPFTERLMLALEACEAAGGDHRGRQSAAIYVMHDQVYPLHDFRVDHHPEPLGALREILEETRKAYYVDFRSSLPVVASCSLETVRPVVAPAPPPPAAAEQLSPVSEPPLRLPGRSRQRRVRRPRRVA